MGSVPRPASPHQCRSDLLKDVSLPNPGGATGPRLVASGGWGAGPVWGRGMAGRLQGPDIDVGEVSELEAPVDVAATAAVEGTTVHGPTTAVVVLPRRVHHCVLGPRRAGGSGTEVRVDRLTESRARTRFGPILGASMSSSPAGPRLTRRGSRGSLGSGSPAAKVDRERRRVPARGTRPQHGIGSSSTRGLAPASRIDTSFIIWSLVPGAPHSVLSSRLQSPSKQTGGVSVLSAQSTMCRNRQGAELTVRTPLFSGVLYEPFFSTTPTCHFS